MARKCGCSLLRTGTTYRGRSNGIEACREIKKLSPDSIAIFMTGQFDKTNIIKEAQFVDAGGRTFYLYKPFAAGELLEVIQKALSEKK